ncbi:hypothetical protein TrRE_jg3789 [Triparma retinervis]|uniref:Ribosome production factor 2 homolog n=1 Tax=Triparma retinervis TaxID=2557542 RepID=A0A9W7CED2_9STRA|nr:hypothetical protein TrRE_jg3789 [Triparma retinervis]
MAPTGKAAQKRLPTEKQPKASVARYLKSVEAQIHEGAKAALLLKGTRCSEVMGNVLKDLRAMKAPDAKLLTKKNEINLFQDATSIEFLCTKNDTSVFALASHNKKRPNNLILGRTFDNQLLDAMELGVENYKGLNFFKGAPKKRVGSKPMFLFVGEKWSAEGAYKKLQNLLLDWFRGDPIESLNLKGLDHVIVVTEIEGKIYFRTYFVKLKRNPNGGDTPVPLLTNAGPDMDLTMRRTQYATPDMWKASLKQPQQLTKRKTKNKSTNMFGETVAKIHLERQDIGGHAGKRTKTLRVAMANEKREESEALEKELEREKEAEKKAFREEWGYDMEEEGEEGGERERGGGRGKRRRT